MPLSQEEYQEWLLHPVTRVMRDRMRADRERLKEAWANGVFASDSTKDAHARGQCAILQQFVDLEVIDLESESP